MIFSTLPEELMLKIYNFLSPEEKKRLIYCNKHTALMVDRLRWLNILSKKMKFSSFSLLFSPLSQRGIELNSPHIENCLSKLSNITWVPHWQLYLLLSRASLYKQYFPHLQTFSLLPSGWNLNDLKALAGYYHLMDQTLKIPSIETYCPKEKSQALNEIFFSEQATQLRKAPEEGGVYLSFYWLFLTFYVLGAEKSALLLNTLCEPSIQPLFLNPEAGGIGLNFDILNAVFTIFAGTPPSSHKAIIYQIDRSIEKLCIAEQRLDARELSYVHSNERSFVNPKARFLQEINSQLLVALASPDIKILFQTPDQNGKGIPITYLVKKAREIQPNGNPSIAKLIKSLEKAAKKNTGYFSNALSCFRHFKEELSPGSPPSVSEADIFNIG